MRYQYVLIPALAGLVAASDNVTDPAATPDALPVEELREVPVPTYTMATGVTNQDIPYATKSAIAAVSSQISADPLSVYPAATNVPINAAGTSGSAGSGQGNSNVVTKRNQNGVARQPHRRGDCAAQPTIANTYNVDVGSADAFRADPIIASVANSANPAPTGYYQTYKNLQAASSAMNYLGYSVIESAKYDVDYCANKCTAKAGCLAFNIYFERDPTQDPGPNCRNPAAFANIKCALWGTGLDASTATNKGQNRTDFEIAIAGSNAYTSYKFGGPIDGWLGPQDLGNAVMNAPLYDCSENWDWTYLGFKLLQAGSVDPRLCAAACDAQTAYNKQHPASDGRAPVSCNAFGSYILTKTDSTGAAHQQGQMCTFYTAYWDKKFATNTVAYDDAIGAEYSYSYSSFYGKKGQQPTCTSRYGQYLSPSGTFLVGGSKPSGVPK